MSATSSKPVPATPRHNQTLSIALVFVCTLLGAAAQILMKSGTQRTEASGVVGLIVAIFSDWHLFSGYALYGLSTVVLIVALKYGQLSILYPVIALTYVWVTILSVILYNESISPFKMLGLTTVIIGVVILGRGMKSAPPPHIGGPAEPLA
ncbi:MAG: cation/cationic drug transporter [Acidobacteriota bacterium]